MLNNKSKKTESTNTTVMTLSYMNVLAEILSITISWVGTGMLLETHTFAEYSIYPIEEDTSPWMMMMIRTSRAAVTFEMLELQDTIMYKVAQMVFATDTVPCGTLKTIYLLTNPEDGMRRLITTYKVPQLCTGHISYHRILRYSRTC
jgi:hypothetical protein